MDFPVITGGFQILGKRKNLLAGEGDWTIVKEFMGYTLDTEVGTVTLPERKLQELLTLVEMPATQRRMVWKDLNRLVGKLCSMHILVPGSVDHMFQIQCALTQGGVYQEWLLPEFHRNIADWWSLALQAMARPTHLAEIAQRGPTHLGFYCHLSNYSQMGGISNPTSTPQL